MYSKTTKTASTTVEFCLEMLLRSETKTGFNPFTVLDDGSIIGARGNKAQLQSDPSWDKPGFCKGHMSLSAIQKVIGTLEFDRCTKISSIRNPYDRAVSAFHAMSKRNPVSQVYQLKQDGESDKIKDMFYQYLCSNEYNGSMHFCINDEYQIDYLIRAESIAADLKNVFSELSVSESLAEHIIQSIPHAKNANRSRYQLFLSDYFSHDSLSIVNDRFSQWFEIGPYTKVSSINDFS